jgi:CDP-diacylglycerol--inositol 3-phosphatidyltransferase
MSLGMRVYVIGQVHLAIQNPTYALMYQLLISLDLSSHYMHMYSQLYSGAESHKSVAKSRSYLLRVYYESANVLFFVCAGNELFFLVIYLLGCGVGEAIDGVLWWIGAASFPICAFKQAVNVVQMVNASGVLAGVDLEERRKKRR